MFLLFFPWLWNKDQWDYKVSVGVILRAVFTLITDQLSAGHYFVLAFCNLSECVLLVLSGKGEEKEKLFIRGNR